MFDSSLFSLSQLGKLSSRFGHHGYGGYGYRFNDWNRWREIDGFLCRDSNDCNWIDSRLYCQDYELDFEPSVSCWKRERRLKLEVDIAGLAIISAVTMRLFNKFIYVEGPD